MRKIGKSKHIGIYIHHQNKEHWLRIKELLPYFSSKLTLLSSLDIKSELDGKCEFIKLPRARAASYPSISNESSLHKKRMHLISSFICQERPDIFYIDESVEVATLVNLLGVPYVYARMKSDIKNDLGRQLAYGMSLFNMADYDNAQEEESFKKTPFYDKTKYYLKDQTEVNKKLFCMYLEEEVCLKKEEALRPLLLSSYH